MAESTEDPLVGRWLENRYRIEGFLARGGMSSVYSALDERLDRRVAVKVMSSALSTDPAFSDRFRREARAAARLAHPNVVAVYDQGAEIDHTGHHVFLVMELIEGRTLRDVLREKRRFSPAEALSVMEPVLMALGAAHRAGIVHRDIKPENILVSDTGAVKVADFGLARAVESDSAATRTGLMMGTVAYCAPEQITKGRADARTDVYAAGIVLFELLTGRPPYTGDSAMTVAYQHVHDQVPAPSEKIPGLTGTAAERIDDLVLSATDRDPNVRPLDAGAFLAQLRNVRADLGLPTLTLPPREPDDRPTGPTHTRRPDPLPARAAGPASAPAHRTSVIDGPAPAHSTSVVPGADTRRGPDPARSGPSGPSVAGTGRRSDTGRLPMSGPPSPPSSPPAKPPADPARSRRRRRRRAVVIVVVVLLLLGAAAGVGGWWLASGRYSTIPDVTGESTAQAGADLKRAGFKVDAAARTEFSETVATGAVSNTDPLIGTRTVRGRSVMLLVSKGQERFTVPDVAGKSSALAQAALAVIPVRVTIANVADDTVPRGSALSTTPTAGTRVRRDSAIILTISTGPPVLAIPVIAAGTPFDDANTTLTTAGFKVRRTDVFNTNVAKDSVISVSPTGTAVKFSVLTVTVSKGPPTVIIPTITNGTLADHAQSTLKKLGLKVKIETQYGGLLGLVVGMDPKAGTEVPVGSTVTLTVV